MKRASKNMLAVALLLFFALGVLCVSLAAPAVSLASVTDCSKHSAPLKMTGCDHPTYFCGFGASSLLFQGLHSSTGSDDHSKNTLDGFGTSLNAPRDPPFLISRQWKFGYPIDAPHKVSTRLFNSILNL
ncbi:MAG: hypothetical protein ACREQ7_07870 [Candidatus Binatia bacterium]